jgi:ribosomal protein S27AE
VSLWAAPAAALAVAWLWFLARGKAAGAVKRLAFRATLLAALAGLVALASVRGVFARTSAGFQAILLLALVGVELGYLYTTRFCPRCGFMVRNLKAASCPRCGAQLPRHGMTSELRRLQPTEPRRGRNGAQ